ncbi:MAG TPA: patatin-like phospholipase family protein, partial [Burkholderiaceae bacterium]|nr:patatin-like phospholipase family protein [Burkholderiaceae bacterium]
MRGYPRGGRPLLAEVFHIPQPDGAGIALDNLQPFVTTHGTLYALFPSRAALQAIAHLEPHVAYTAQPRRTNSEVAYAQAGYAQVAASPHASKTANGAANTIDAATAPNDRFCDVVMEGGVTSGIIYSSAVEQLAKDYRFRNIGGSSIGAFAAALTAAAEYRRRKGEIDAFRYLAELPDKLAEEKKDATEEDKHAPEQDVCKAREAERRRNEDKGKTLLLRMFRPQPATRRLFEIFLSILGNKSTISRVRDGLAAALRQYRVVVLLAVVATLVLVLAGPLAMTWHGLSASPLSVQVLGWVSWGFALLTALASAVVVALLLALLWDFGHGVVGNGFGLCRGWTKGQSADVVDLTWFMHVAIQEAAGRHPIDDPPLTFKDLWDAPGNPADVLGYKGNGDDWRSINLEVYATNLAHGRPYRFPLDEEDDMGRLFFRIDELENYFPGPLLQHLVQYAETYRPKKLNVDPERIKRPEEYLELPRENHDTTMMRMPGVRDRVVRVLLKPGEGGVNINMSGEEI